MGRMERRLGRLEGVAGREARRASEWDLSVFDDDELEELAVLARKAEDANRLGRTVVWKADEAAALIRLKVKSRRAGGVAASIRT